MYLAADEPVIVWREASFAPFIEANHLGLVIDDLSQLPDTLAAVSEEDYHAMIARVQAMGPLIRNGFFLKKPCLTCWVNFMINHNPNNALF